MAFAIIVEIPGGTLDQYDKVSEAMRLTGAEEASPGLVIHFAGLAGDSLVVIDVWESREAYQSHLDAMGEEGAAKPYERWACRPTRTASSKSTIL